LETEILERVEVEWICCGDVEPHGRDEVGRLLTQPVVGFLEIRTGEEGGSVHDHWEVDASVGSTSRRIWEAACNKSLGRKFGRPNRI
jgi:hypothetical protein